MSDSCSAGISGPTFVLPIAGFPSSNARRCRSPRYCVVMVGIDGRCQRVHSESWEASAIQMMRNFVVRRARYRLVDEVLSRLIESFSMRLKLAPLLRALPPRVRGLYLLRSAQRVANHLISATDYSFRTRYIVAE